MIIAGRLYRLDYYFLPKSWLTCCVIFLAGCSNRILRKTRCHVKVGHTFNQHNKNKNVITQVRSIWVQSKAITLTFPWWQSYVIHDFTFHIKEGRENSCDGSLQNNNGHLLLPSEIACWSDEGPVRVVACLQCFLHMSAIFFISLCLRGNTLCSVLQCSVYPNLCESKRWKQHWSICHFYSFNLLTSRCLLSTNLVRTVLWSNWHPCTEVSVSVSPLWMSWEWVFQVDLGEPVAQPCFCLWNPFL